MKPSQLPNQVRLEGPELPGAMLYCAVCGAEYSAHRGDYWNREDKPMKCHGRVLKLVRRVVTHEALKRSEGAA